MINKQVHALTIEYQWEHTLLWVLLGVLGILLCVYLYFVAASVLNIIAHKEATVRSAQLETAIGQLEREYFALSQNLTPETGALLGLSAVNDQEYVYRPGTVGAATFDQGAI
ncbi:hypothetical protein FJY93_01435 [Candidatus Kaiserbacteria bacterium]|nr:hypothetical protein [Candidatus Kaiserbacteria bacterium]